jgi:putative Mn2+ efflux pump MntP
MYLLFSICSLGFDSFLGGLTIGFDKLSWRDRFRLALAFGACDGIATLAGSLWWPRLAEQQFAASRPTEPAAFAVYLICLLLVLATARKSRILIYSLPVLLCVDNFFCGLPASSAAALGASSATMALVGLTVAALGGHIFLARKAEA